MDEGATVRVYAVSSLCAEAKNALDAGDPESQGVGVGVACLPPSWVGRGGRLDLAAIGAGARRAVEDSTAVAYLAEPGRATSFSEPILDEAEIPTITSSSGSRSMTQVLDALSARGSDESPRESVWEVR
ncbi:MAG TPA: hypothetical protein VIT85_06805 [Solirubrobacterales bacterium]